MNITPDELHQINDIIKAYHLRFTLNLIGSSYFSAVEKNLLKKFFGKDILNENFIPIIDQIYLMGQLAVKIGDPNLLSLSYNDFILSLNKDQYPKYGKIEDKSVEKYKKQAYLDVLSSEFYVSKDIRQTLLNVVDDTKKDTIEQFGEILKNKLPDWNNNINASISYLSQTTFERGKVDKIKEIYGEDKLVYKMPLPGACKYCIAAYLVNGVGSRPRIFKLRELVANGDNIGRKPADWLPVLGAMHPHCYDKETEVLTNEGWKFFKDLTGQEKCLTFNLETENVKWSKIKNKINYHYKGNMHLYEHESFSLMVTPEHKQVVSKRYKENGICKYKNLLIEDNKLPKSSRFFKSIPNYIGEDVENISLYGYTFNTKDFVSFMAYYLSEGNCTERPINFEVKISQERKGYFEDILNCSRNCFGPNVKGEGKNAIYIYVNKEFGNWLKSFGYSYEKYIPSIIKSLDKKYLEIFLEKYINGDGSRKNTNKEFHNYNFVGIEETISTTSYKMASDLSELILKIGKAPKIFIESNKGRISVKKDGSIIESKRPLYRIAVNKSQYSSAKRQIVEYDDEVYCVEVEDNHTLFIKRKGNITISGNCRCTLHYLPNNVEWDEERQVFVPKLVEGKKIERKSKVKVYVGNRVFEV